MTRERELRALELSGQLWTHERIAAALGVSRSAVTRMLQRIERRYLETIRNKLESLKGEKLRQLESIADEAMQAWRASKQPKKEARKTNRKQGKKGDEEETRVQTREQSGDWHYLEQARGAVGDIRKLMGLDAPTKTALTDPGGDQAYDPFAGIKDRLISRLSQDVVEGTAAQVPEQPQPG